MWIQLPDTTGTRWRRLLVVAAGVLVLLVAVVSYAAFANRDPSAEAGTTAATSFVRTDRDPDLAAGAGRG